MRLLEKAFKIIAPHDCLGCGQEGSLLCQWCRPDALIPLPPQCYHCHRLSPDSLVCKHCRPKTRLRHVWLTAEYEGLAKRLIYELKFGRNRAAAEIIAEAMHDTLPYLPADTLVSYVPTSTTHVRRRGYDQAKLIADELAHRLARRHLTLLSRTGQIQQVGSKRAERLTQLSDAFRPVRFGGIKGATILLIDDVLTTGATLEEAARTLKKAGAKRVLGAVFARTQ